MIAALIAAGGLGCAAPAAAQATLAEMEAAEVKTGMTALRTLREEFPAEYEKLAAQYLAYVRDGRSDPERRDLIGRAIRDFSRRHAVALRKADPGLIQNVVESRRQLLSTVMLSEKGQACTQWLYTGAETAGLKANAKLYTGARDRLTSAFIRAVASGERAPVDSGVWADKDWDLMFEQYLVNGGTVTELQQIPSRPDNACETTLKLIEALSQIPGVGGQRVRAEYMYTTSW